jgi:renalase
MRIGVVGAGIGGLGAARELVARGHQAVVFDVHERPGGRLATYRANGFTFDMGATAIAPRSRSLLGAMRDELDSTDLEPLSLSVASHTGLRLVPESVGKNSVERFAYGSGNDRLADLLSKGLDLRMGRTVLSLDRDGGGFSIHGEEFDALVVATPSPEAARLLATVGERRSLGNCTYRMCLSVALGFGKEISPRPYFALVDPAQRHPLTWISFESLKCSGRAPEGCTAIVTQLSAEYSADHFHLDESAIVSTVLGLLQKHLGPGWDAPVLSRVYRWPYSHPENIALFETVNHPGTRLAVAGDCLAGARVEYAYDVGIRAARLLLEEP